VRLLYICLGYLLAPVAFGVHLWRGLWDRAHWEALGERWGFGARLSKSGIWLHAVSVGEVQAAQPLVAALRRAYPDAPLLVTTSTVTGRAQARRLYGETVALRYLPYDLPGASRRFIERVRPQVAVILETELWPTLYRTCETHGVPVVIASARLSPRSTRRYQRFLALLRPLLRSVAAIGAQTAADAERFIALGADPARTTITGNLKFDVELAPDLLLRGEGLRGTLGRDRTVWTAGSTHEGEEALALAAHKRLQQDAPGALLVLAPRHPPRFPAVRALLESERISFVTRSSGAPVTSATQVLLLDTLGELVVFYAASDVAFIGGSLVPVGGHNLLEPAMCSRAVLAGPHLENATAARQLLVTAGALEVVENTETLAERLRFHASHRDESRRMGARAREAVFLNRGAVDRIVALVAAVRPASGLTPSG
jgi:3-deoxy-D-manno-octulosonic-acid transferase